MQLYIFKYDFIDTYTGLEAEGHYKCEAENLSKAWFYFFCHISQNKDGDIGVLKNMRFIRSYNIGDINEIPEDKVK